MTRTRLRTLLPALATVVLLAACGTGEVTQGPTTFPARPADGLVAQLTTPPAGSTPGSSSWAQDYKPSLPQYVDYFYGEKARPRVTTLLKQQGVRDIAHVLWVTSDQEQADVVVLAFRDDTGAAAHLSFLETNAGKDTAYSRTVLDTAHDPVAYYSDKAVKDGFWLTKAYARVGTSVVELFVYSAEKAPLTLATEWIAGQISRLD